MTIIIRSWFLYLLLACLAVLVFLPGLSGDFVLDDGFNILQNRLLYVNELTIENLIFAALSFHDGVGGRPLPMLTFALDYWRAGSMDASVFKATNLIIHGITTFFMGMFLHRFFLLAGKGQKAALFLAGTVALVWAVHPLQVSSVMYVVQRMQTMVALFQVMALWAYLDMRKQQVNGLGRGRIQGVCVVVFWLAAFACKEDAALLFPYVLVLELTVLRFKAEDPQVTKGLKQSFALITSLGALAYFFIVLPHYWHWEAYHGRDFSSAERLMTQARVLVMYIYQIVVPIPDNMTFIYDGFEVSRSLLQPWTTLLSIIFIVCLLFFAWRLKNTMPVFSFGILFFFSGHFITSNVIALELVFEHRNYLPLLGIVLAVADILYCTIQKMEIRGRRWMMICGGVVVGFLAAATLSHAHTWGDPVRHAKKVVSLLPESTRAWTQLTGAYFDLYKKEDDEAYLHKAISVSKKALARVQTPTLSSNLIIYRSLLGEASSEDWNTFMLALKGAPQSWQNKFAVWTLMNNVDKGIDIDKQRVVEAIDILSDKAAISSNEYLRMAVFVYKYANNNEAALPYFVRFAEGAAYDDPSFEHVAGEMRSVGRDDWADVIMRIKESKMENGD